jgi:hypothetical protein
MLVIEFAPDDSDPVITPYKCCIKSIWGNGTVAVMGGKHDSYICKNIK